MINLLPPEAKRQMRAARSNVVLRRYFVILLIGLGLTAGVFLFGIQITVAQRVEADKIKAKSEASARDYAETRKAADNFTKDLATAKTILASDIKFSDLITDIAGVVPSGVILSDLSFTAENLNAPLVINARATTYDNAVKLKNSLEDSPIFENVSFQRVSSEGTESQATEITAKYPVIATVSVKLSKRSNK